METVEIRYDASRAIYWCIGCLVLAACTLSFALAFTGIAVEGLKRDNGALVVLMVALALAMSVGSWFMLREARKHWKWSRNSSVILVFTTDTFRDRRPPHYEIRWLDIRAARLQTELTEGLLTAAAIEIQVARENRTVSVLVPVLGLDRDPERIFHLMERYIFVATRNASAPK